MREVQHIHNKHLKERNEIKKKLEKQIEEQLKSSSNPAGKSLAQKLAFTEQNFAEYGKKLTKVIDILENPQKNTKKKLQADSKLFFIIY